VAGRSWMPIAGVALLAVLAGLAFPTDGSGYVDSHAVLLTATGPSPSTLRMEAGAYMLFSNNDSVPHTVVFANGRCSLTVTPGEVVGPGNSVDGSQHPACIDDFPFYAGSYTYTVDGKIPGTVDTVTASRSVTLTARTSKIRRGERLTLHGRVLWNNQCCDLTSTVPFPVIVLARNRPSQPFKQIATVTVHHAAHGDLWQLRVRPGVTTTYLAEANGQLPEGRIWTTAESRLFSVRVGPRRYFVP
jgi:plastocyanin